MCARAPTDSVSPLLGGGHSCERGCVSSLPGVTFPGPFPPTPGHLLAPLVLETQGRAVGGPEFWTHLCSGGNGLSGLRLQERGVLLSVADVGPEVKQRQVSVFKRKGPCSREGDTGREAGDGQGSRALVATEHVAWPVMAWSSLPPMSWLVLSLLQGRTHSSYKSKLHQTRDVGRGHLCSKTRAALVSVVPSFSNVLICFPLSNFL